MSSMTKLHLRSLHRLSNPSNKSFKVSYRIARNSVSMIRAVSPDFKVATILKTTCLAIVATAALIFNFNEVVPVHAAATRKPTSSLEEIAIEEDGGLAEEEENVLEEHLSRNPKDVKALRSLMEVRIKLMKLLEAIEVVNRLIEVEPYEEEWPLLRAQLYWFSGDMDSARREFEEIVDKNPFKVEGYHGLLMVESDCGKPLEQIAKRIEDIMNKCKKDEPSDLRDFKILKAQVNVMEERYEEALQVYEELAKEDPMDFRPYLCQGIIYSLMRNSSAAHRTFEQFTKLVPKNHPYREYFFDNMLATTSFIDKLERNSPGYAN